MSLDRLEEQWLPSSGTNIQAAMLITKIKEQRRIASGTHGREKIVALIDGLLASDPQRKLNGGQGYDDERDAEDERLLALKAGSGE